MPFYRNSKRCDTCELCKECTYMKYATASKTSTNTKVTSIACKNCPCMSKFGTCLRSTKTGCKNHKEKK